MDKNDLVLESYIFSSFERGAIFFAEDLEGCGLTPDGIRWSLASLVLRSDGIVRLGRGVYCIPKTIQGSGKLLIPSTEVIADTLAARWKVRIAPCGAQATYLAGLTGIQTHRYTWVSDGSSQVFHLQNGVTVQFIRRLSMKIFQFRDERLRNIVEAMRYLGKEGIGVREREIIADALVHVSGDDFLHDVRLAPLWIRELLCQLR